MFSRVSARGLASVPAICVLLLLTACPQSPSVPATSGLPPVSIDPTAPSSSTPRNRYSFNNQCFVLQSVENDNFVASSGGGYAASAADITGAEAFYLKPTALGYYLLFNRSREVLAGGATASNQALNAVTDTAVFEMRARGDSTTYPENFEVWVATATSRLEPTKAEVDTYRNFADPQILNTQFWLTADALNLRLAVDATDTVIGAAPANTDAQAFRLQAANGCVDFPEAHDNTVGESFSGTTSDDTVLGMVDAHVHMSATEFLGKSEWGFPFHKFGVTHALADCDEYHGPAGNSHAAAAVLETSPEHDTTGWPTHPYWPGRDRVAHEAIYWKWVERAWKAGLRIMVNELVENETLCEIARSSGANPQPAMDCNSMNNAGRQAGTMYALEDYIDAQYGGRGEGWFQIVHGAAEAREVVEAGKLAVVLGIEISNLLDCQVNYGTLRSQEPLEEDGSGGLENAYECDAASIATRLDRLIDYGVRKVITIHEFDNAFGGNGIFEGLVLGAGNRENSGLFNGAALLDPAGEASPPELPSGEFWTTYDCPEEGGLDIDGDPFSGYLGGGSGGTSMPSLEPTCFYQGQGDGTQVGSVRPGGPTICYPLKNQCNARWLTPIGLDMYSTMMEKGIIFDIDHLELEMKTQALELAEAQDPPYPFVSTHGTFGGTSIEQVSRIFRNGGFIFPSLGNGPDHIGKITELRQIHATAWTPAEILAGDQFLFGLGFGTDTNGLSSQQGPRSNIEAGKEVVYPYRLFSGGLFDQLSEFQSIAAVEFQQPEERDHTGAGRTWHTDMDGSAHYGMLSGMVQEINLEGSAQDMRDLYNAAEVYLQMWERTEASRDGIAGNPNGEVIVPAGILRRAPSFPAGSGRRITPPGP